MLWHFVKYLPADSAYAAESRPDLFGWQGTTRLPMLIADLIDTLNEFRYEYAISNTPRGKPKPHRLKRVPRPGVEDQEDGQRLGHDPIPIKGFDAWWDSHDTTQQDRR